MNGNSKVRFREKVKKEKYYPWDNYSMKCRIYPNKTQRDEINTIIHGVHAFCNMVSYDMHERLMYTTEKPSKKGDGTTVHFQKLSEARKKEALDKYREENPCIKEIPASALSSMKFSCLLDIEKQYKRLGDDNKYHKLPIEFVEHKYYSKSHPRTSYTYQETLAKVRATENKNVIKFDFCKLGPINVRGWNQDIRFDENADMNFVDYAKANPQARIRVTIKKDTCGDYFVIFGFSHSERNGNETGFITYVPFKEEPDDRHAVGIDVGVADLAITSDGKKYYNPQFAKGAADRRAIYQKKMSSAEGYSNVKFREAKKKNPELKPSKNYWKWRIKSTKISRRTARKRDNRWNNVTADIVANASIICVETLSVKKMMDRDAKHEELGTRDNAAKSNFGMSDAAMSSGLAKLKYKAAGYKREIREIGVYERSTGVCPDCEYVTEPLPIGTRFWVCPQCGKEWDSDIAAAIVIKKKGMALDAKSENSDSKI